MEMPVEAGRGSLCRRRPTERAMGHDTLPLPHVVYQAEVVRFLLKPAPGHEGFATASSVVCSTSFLTRRTLPSRNRPTPNGCAKIAHGDFAQKTLFRRSVLRTFA